jgi:hypothetical protein
LSTAPNDGRRSTGHDPTPYAAAGATWWLVEFAPDTVTVDVVRGVVRDNRSVPSLHEATDRGEANG